MIEVRADFRVPYEFEGDSHIIPPDSVIQYMGDRYNLTNPGLRIIDPFSGANTIPRVLRSMGAERVDSRDINPNYVALAQRDARFLKAWGLGSGVVKLADVGETYIEEPYDVVFGSLPFSLFMGEGSISPEYAHGILNLLKPDGIVIIDSAPMAVRAGVEIPVADRQVAYFEKHGLELVERVDFQTSSTQDSFDSRFTELVFRRRLAQAPLTFLSRLAQQQPVVYRAAA